MPGICTSSRTTANESLAARARSPRPRSGPRRRARRAAAAPRASAIRFAGVSSTTRTLGELVPWSQLPVGRGGLGRLLEPDVQDGEQAFGIDGLGDVLRGARRERLLAVALHRLRRERDDRQRLEAARCLGSRASRRGRPSRASSCPSARRRCRGASASSSSATLPFSAWSTSMLARLEDALDREDVAAVVVHEQDLLAREVGVRGKRRHVRLGRRLVRAAVLARRRPRRRSSTGRRSVNVLPSPGALLTSIAPPSRRAISRLMVSPRPVPPYLRLVVPSACWNASKMSFCLSSGMPMPVSCTAKRMDLRRRRARARRASSTPPFAVNLNAFDSRFLRICCRRVGSLNIVAGSRSVHRDVEGEALLLGDVPERPLDVVAHLVERERARVDRHLARLDLRQVEDLVDELQQIVARRVDRLRELHLLAGQVAVRGSRRASWTG